MVTALFNDRDSAERGYGSAGKLGYEKSDVSLIMSEEVRQRYFPAEGQGDTALSSRANEGAGKKAEGSMLGGPIGGTVGTIAPVVVAWGTVMLIPGVIFAGPIAIALVAAGTVSLVGGLIGALANWGIPTARAEEYEADIRKGGILMGVKAHNAKDASSLEQEWKASGGQLVHS